MGGGSGTHQLGVAARDVRVAERVLGVGVPAGVRRIGRPHRAPYEYARVTPTGVLALRPLGSGEHGVLTRYSHGAHGVLNGWALGRQRPAYEMEKTSGMALALPTATSHSRNGSWCGGELTRGVPTVRHATVLAGC